MTVLPINQVFSRKLQKNLSYKLTFILAVFYHSAEWLSWLEDWVQCGSWLCNFMSCMSWVKSFKFSDLQFLYLWCEKGRNNWLTLFCSVSQLCPTLCDPKDCSTPGFPVHSQLLELTQTHGHRVSDAIQPFHPLLSPSPPAFSLSQHQGLFQWVNSSQQVAKVLEFQLQHQPFQWIFRADFLQDGLIGSPCRSRHYIL